VSDSQQSRVLDKDEVQLMIQQVMLAITHRILFSLTVSFRL
jgi:hypothetical protein